MAPSFVFMNQEFENSILNLDRESLEIFDADKEQNIFSGAQNCRKKN